MKIKVKYIRRKQRVKVEVVPAEWQDFEMEV